MLSDEASEVINVSHLAWRHLLPTGNDIVSYADDDKLSKACGSVVRRGRTGSSFISVVFVKPCSVTGADENYTTAITP